MEIFQTTPIVTEFVQDVAIGFRCVQIALLVVLLTSKEQLDSESIDRYFVLALNRLFMFLNEIIFQEASLDLI